MTHILLLGLIQTLFVHKPALSQTNICIWGRLGVNSAINGLYTHEGTHNNKPYYRKPAQQYCDELYIYYKSFSRWYISRALGINYLVAECYSDPVLANCNEWYVWDGSTDVRDVKVTISTDECPTITSTSLQHHEYINVPYSTSLSSQYFDYTINDVVGANLEQVNIYYGISGSPCHIPRLTLWSWDNDDHCPTIVISDMLFNTYGCLVLNNTNTKYQKCVSDYDLSKFLNGDSISSLHIKLDPMNPTLSTKTKIQLSCWVPTNVTIFPTRMPTKSLTNNPTSTPTKIPSKHPTSNPTASSEPPTYFYTTSPTNNPTVSPSQIPLSLTILPNTTSSPTYTPTPLPTSFTTKAPTNNPSKFPSYMPINNPSISPSILPTESPTKNPTISPSTIPTTQTNIFEITAKTVDEKFATDNETHTVVIIVITLGAFVTVLIIIFMLYRALKRQIVQVNEGANKPQYDKVNSQMDLGDIMTPNESRQQEGKDVEMITLHNDMHATNTNSQITTTGGGGSGEDMHSLSEREKQIKMWFKNHVKLHESNDKYYNLFVSNGYDELSLISEITNAELTEMGVEKLGHRKRILKAAKEIDTNVVFEEDSNDNLDKPQAKYTCVICMENEPNTLNLPCGHSCWCLECADNGTQQSKSCPSCKQTITECIQIFNAGFENNSYH